MTAPTPRELKQRLRAGVEALIAGAVLDGLPRFRALDWAGDIVEELWKEDGNDDNP